MNGGAVGTSGEVRARRGGAVTLACGLILGAACTGAPDGASQRTEGGPDRAVALVDRALSVTAGPEEVRRAGGLVLALEGVRNAGAEYQGLHPDSLSPGRYTESLVFDPATDRVGREYRHDRYDGTHESLREVWGPGDERTLFILDAGFAVRLASDGHETARLRIARRLPGMLLAEIRERAAGLRHLGHAQGLEIVAASLMDGSVVDLGIDPGTSALRRVSYRQDAPAFGDLEVVWRFDDYREVDGLGRVPHVWTVDLAGRRLLDLEVTEARVGSVAVAGRLDPPEGIELPEEPQPVGDEGDAAADVEVREVAPGVYMATRLRGGFHPMFVELEEFVVAVDATAGYPLFEELPASDVAPGPTSAWLTDRFLELIRESVPDKPVRYVVLTHFHNDHAGGLRSFVAEGATVLAASTDAPAVRALLAAPHTLAPDRLAREGGEPSIEVVEGRREITDGTRTLEVIDVGPNPHTTGMLVVRLPNEDLWFVSDLLDPASVARFPKPEHQALDRWFGDWLARGGHEPERIYTMHGTGLVTPEHLERLGEVDPAGPSG